MLNDTVFKSDELLKYATFWADKSINKLCIEIYRDKINEGKWYLVGFYIHSSSRFDLTFANGRQRIKFAFQRNGKQFIRNKQCFRFK